MRQVILDTETTGLSAQQGHRIIEIGCVEMIHRRLTGKVYHTYVQPDRAVDPGAVSVHGITNQFLKGKPRFIEIAQEFKEFIYGAELIIHNAPFDVSFIENEFHLLNDEQWKILNRHCQILDTLQLARRKHPGQRNNLDALCKRYNINFQHRDKHGALVDAKILSEVYLAMTGGQNKLALDESAPISATTTQTVMEVVPLVNNLVIPATPVESKAHRAFLDEIEAKLGVKPIWGEVLPD